MLKPIYHNQRKMVSRTESLPPPTGGWDAVSPIADMKINRAIVLENWFPTYSDVRVRRGHEIWAAGMTGPIETLMAYNAPDPANSKMFAAADLKIYDVTLQQAATATSVTGKSLDRWQWVNMTVAGGHYLWICNGVDDPIHYNGSTWANPTITGITASSIINVNVHKNRLWMVLKNSTKVAYLATGAVAGAATEFQLGGLLTKGGFIMAMTTWTIDGGEGVDDLAVFVSSRGQVIVYQGTDPADADSWFLVGVYDLGAPIGRRCFLRVAGDVALINIDGVLPLSKALRTDRASAAQVALTANITNAMNEAARELSDNFGWEMVSYPKGTMALLNVPVTENSIQHQYVMNTLTGAWCKFIGMNANCWLVFNDELYFGGNSGRVLHADTGAADLNESIDAIGQQAYSYYSPKSSLKHFKMVQPLLTISDQIRPSVGLSTDFKDNANISTPGAVPSTSASWDDSFWDQDTFAQISQSVTYWESVTGIGFCASIHFRARTGDEGAGLWDEGLWNAAEWGGSTTGDAIVRLNGFNVLYEPGNVF